MRELQPKLKNHFACRFLAPLDVRALYVLLFLWYSTGIENVRAAEDIAQQLSTAQALEQKRPDIEERRFAFEKEKEEKNLQLENKKARLTALSVTVPLALGLVAYIIQIFIQRRNESLQFKLKAAEIAMAARDSSQVGQKAAILKALFPTELKGFEPGKFDPKQFPFSESIERRERLIRLLAEYPSSRKEIIQAWALSFPWETSAPWGPEQRKAYQWFEELQKDDTLNRNKPSDPSNESLQFKLKAAEIAMAARDSSQVGQKAEILKALFPDELKGFEPGKFDPKQFPFSESVERRERLIRLLAEYPSSRKEVIQAWALSFPWDAGASWSQRTPDGRSSYRWFEEIQKDDTLNRNTS